MTVIKCPHCEKTYSSKGLATHVLRTHLNDKRFALSGPIISKKLKGIIPWNKGLTVDSSESVKQGRDSLAKAFIDGKVIGGFANRTHSDKTKTIIAKAMKGNVNGNHRGDRQSYYKGIRMDSSWEVKTAKYLDDNGIAWTYGVTIFMLSETRSYRPDFTLADGSIIEVKGYWRAKNKLKFEEWVQKYPHIKYEIWDKAKLKSLGLL